MSTTLRLSESSARSTRSTLNALELRLVAFLGVVVLQVVQWWAFRSIIAQRYGYDGFTGRHVDAVTVLLAIVLSCAPVTVLPIRIVRPSGGILWVLYVLGLLPACLYPILVEGLSVRTTFGFELLAVASFVLIVWLVDSLPQHWPVIPTPVRRRVLIAIAVCVAIAGALLIKSFGIPTSFVAIGDVYVRRLDFRGEAASANPLFGYIIPWLQNVVAPIMIVAGLARRKLVWVAIGVGIEVWMYLTIGNRQALLGVFLIGALYLLFSDRCRDMFASLMMIGLAAGIVVTVLYDRRGGSPYAVGVFLYRMFALPGIITAEYYDYFSGAPKVIGRDGLFGAVSASPYDLTIPREIGLRYFGSADTNANANMWADGFANFGVIGFIVVVVALVPVLWLIDLRVRPTEAGAVAASSAFLCVNLANGSVLTAMLTGGLLPFAVVMAVTRGSLVARPMPPNSDGDSVNQAGAIREVKGGEGTDGARRVDT